MNHYELFFVLPGTFTETEVPAQVDRIFALVTDAKGEGVKMYDLGKSRLAYPMKHIRYGYFHLCRFDADPQVAVLVQQKVRLVPDLLRATVQLYDPAKDPEPKITQHVPTQSAAAAVRTPHVDMTIPEAAQAPQAARQTVPAAPKEETKVTLEEIGQKLDEILDKELTDV